MSSTLPPFTQDTEFFYERMHRQIALNHQILGSRPDLQEKILRARQKIRELNYVNKSGAHLVPEDLDLLQHYLVSPDQLQNILDGFLMEKMGGYYVETYLKDLRESSVESLRGTISAMDCTKGFTDVEVCRRFEEEIKAQPEWMILEARGILSLGDFSRIRGPTRRATSNDWKKLYLSLDVKSPAEDRVRRTVADGHLFFLVGDRDPFIGGVDQYLKELEHWGNSPKHSVIPMPDGNHFSGYEQKTVELIVSEMNLPTAARVCDRTLQ